MIGFGNDPSVAADRRQDLLAQVMVDDVLDFGMIPELVGRLPVISTLSALSEDDLMHVLTEPKNALVKQFQKFFEIEGSELEFTPQSLREIARIAKLKETGARGLRSVVEDVMFELMYELPDRQRGQRYVITPEVVRGETKLLAGEGSAAA